MAQDGDSNEISIRRQLERDDDDEDDEDFEDESLYERLTALSEMFPDRANRFARTTSIWTGWAIKETFNLFRSALWIGSTTAMITVLPYIIERERSALQAAQIDQQRQLLLGPSAAIAAANVGKPTNVVKAA